MSSESRVCWLKVTFETFHSAQEKPDLLTKPGALLGGLTEA